MPPHGQTAPGSATWVIPANQGSRSLAARVRRGTGWSDGSLPERGWPEVLRLLAQYYDHRELSGALSLDGNPTTPPKPHHSG